MKRQPSDDENDRDEMDVDSEGEGDKDEYFMGYVKPSVHRVMLEDAPRTQSYLRWMQQNRSLIEGRRVLDVGAGTGLLSMMAAKCGAARVWAIEASQMASACREIVRANQMQNIIKVIKGKAEDVSLGDKVDVLVSEWMGFHALNEGMLDSVLKARDLHLDPRHGKMVPGTVRLWCAPVAVPTPEVDFWGEPFLGFDFSPLLHVAMAERMGNPSLVPLQATSLLAQPHMLCDWDLHTLPSSGEVLDCVKGMCEWTIQKAGRMNAIAIWFDCPDIGLDTSPLAPPTHWGQTSIFLPEWTDVQKGQPLAAAITLERSSENSRSYDAHVQVSGFDGHPLDCMCAKCHLLRVSLENEDEGDDDMNM